MIDVPASIEDVRRERERAYQAAYRAANRERIAARKSVWAAAWYLNNVDRVRVAGAAYRSAHPGRPERKIRTDAAYRARNREAIRSRKAAYRAANKEQIAARQAAQPELNRARHARRRALKRGAAICDLTRAQWESIKAVFDHSCVYCGTRSKTLTQDHIVPLSRGGNHTASNVVPACVSCNSSKFTGSPPVPVQPLLFV